MSTLDDFTSDAAAAVDEDTDECECDDLPDHVPCWPCYQDGAEFGGDDA